jgi:hypothetical protein
VIQVDALWLYGERESERNRITSASTAIEPLLTASTPGPEPTIPTANAGQDAKEALARDATEAELERPL